MKRLVQTLTVLLCLLALVPLGLAQSENPADPGPVNPSDPVAPTTDDDPDAEDTEEDEDTKEDEGTEEGDVTVDEGPLLGPAEMPEGLDGPVRRKVLDLPPKEDPEPDNMVREKKVKPRKFNPEAVAGATSDAEGTEDIEARREPPPEEDASLVEQVIDRFRFGSYGRVQPSLNLDGGPGTQTRIVYPTPRVDEGSYLEVEFGYLAYKDTNGVEVDVDVVLAWGDDLFHFDGDFDASPAIRNLYLEARNLFWKGTVIWAGSRMYRGDDVYLLDFWPLDNLNTYGGGIGYRGDKTRIELHTGVNRLENDYQYQAVDVVDERFVGAREVVFMDRVRSISSLKGEQQWGGRDGNTGLKAKIYGEFHYLGEGQLRLEQPRREEFLPSDNGFAVGLQLGTWNFMPKSFVNLFVRYGQGLAAYGETAIPFGLDDQKQASAASNLMIALSANIEHEFFGVLVGGFARYFVDADGVAEDFDDGWDAAWSVRPMAFIGDYFTPGIEISHQIRRPNGVSPVNGLQEAGNVWKFSVLPALTFGDGMYARPQLRLNYTVSLLDEAAQRLYPIDDPRRGAEVVHYLGLAAEWWFNSSSYQ